MDHGDILGRLLVDALWQAGHSLSQPGQGILGKVGQTMLEPVTEGPEPTIWQIIKTKQAPQDRSGGSTKTVRVIPLTDLDTDAVINTVSKFQRIDQRADFLENLAVAVLPVTPVNSPITILPIIGLRHLVQAVTYYIGEPTSDRYFSQR